MPIAGKIKKRGVKASRALTNIFLFCLDLNTGVYSPLREKKGTVKIGEEITGEVSKKSVEVGMKATKEFFRELKKGLKKMTKNTLFVYIHILWVHMAMQD